MIAHTICFALLEKPFIKQLNKNKQESWRRWFWWKIKAGGITTIK